MPQFIPGRKLNRMFYQEVVGPLMEKNFPTLKYSSGLVGHGSDVLGNDTPQSTDHNWGPYQHMFFSEGDFIQYKDKVDKMLQNQLPYTYKGFSTHFKKGNRYLKDVPHIKKSGKINHLFQFWTLRSFFMHYLGFDVEKEPTIRDWLLFPQQSLTEIVSGEFYRDDLQIEDVRKKFSYYPDDVWKYVMRVQWGKILDELVLQARSGEVGDEVGSMVVTARTVHKIMVLCFLIEKKYYPYSKWFGTEFQKLKRGKKMYPLILQIIHEKNWAKRQECLAKAYQALGRMHNKLKITPPLTTRLINYFGRDYPIIDVWEYVHGIEKTIKNDKLRNMKYPLGSVDQFIDHARINQLDYFYTDLTAVIK